MDSGSRSRLSRSGVRRAVTLCARPRKRAAEKKARRRMDAGKCSSSGASTFARERENNSRQQRKQGSAERRYLGQRFVEVVATCDRYAVRSERSRSNFGGSVGCSVCGRVSPDRSTYAPTPFTKLLFCQVSLRQSFPEGWAIYHVLASSRSYLPLTLGNFQSNQLCKQWPMVDRPLRINGIN